MYAGDEYLSADDAAFGPFTVDPAEAAYREWENEQATRADRATWAAMEVTG